jgi:beta-lactamase class A
MARENSKCTGKFELIRPDFNCDEYTQSTDILTTLRSALEKDVKQYELNRDATRISVWVRDLTTLQWMGVNEKEEYAPASLFKVPVMIAIFKYAEIEPSILDQKIVFSENSLVSENDRVEPEYRLVAGQEYTMEQVIEQMIKYSDNDAYALLVNRLSDEFLLNVYADLGMAVRPGMSMGDQIVNARSYANIFRSLYQSSYLTPLYSQKALEILADTAISTGARSGIPQTVKMAHKFGVRRELSPDGTVVSLKFHDCGIVYAPSRPFLFCILTEGTSEDRLQTIIESLAAKIFSSFSR